MIIMGPYTLPSLGRNTEQEMWSSVSSYIIKVVTIVVVNGRGSRPHLLHFGLLQWSRRMSHCLNASGKNSTCLVKFREICKEEKKVFFQSNKRPNLFAKSPVVRQMGSVAVCLSSVCF